MTRYRKRVIEVDAIQASEIIDYYGMDLRSIPLWVARAIDQEKLRAYFVALDTTEDGRKKLEAIKVPGYAPFDPQELLTLGTWLRLAC